ncbi:hypothetical protein SAMN05192529_12915 [Arachidicoccus rhizosphaerae]|uniref:Uncharacterized protein n=1 Tax=Arachidicoccus rhizosphaerae TaxID=551991 RepID=A0A1H4C956_9BACT|nr:hypothetical protein SAMN05192529_12915 [Arachidicoccus rhizosphaerae]
MAVRHPPNNYNDDSSFSGHDTLFIRFFGIKKGLTI